MSYSNMKNIYIAFNEMIRIQYLYANLYKYLYKWICKLNICIYWDVVKFPIAKNFFNNNLSKKYIWILH